MAFGAAVIQVFFFLQNTSVRLDVATWSLPLLGFPFVSFFMLVTSVGLTSTTNSKTTTTTTTMLVRPTYYLPVTVSKEETITTFLCSRKNYRRRSR